MAPVLGRVSAVLRGRSVESPVVVAGEPVFQAPAAQEVQDPAV